MLVLWVVDARNRAFDAKFFLCHLADDEIVFVVPCCRHHDVGAIHPRFHHRTRVRTVALNGNAAQIVDDDFDLFGVLFDNRDFVTRRKQMFRQIVTDLARADDDDVHYAPTISRMRSAPITVEQTVSRPSKR